MEHTIKMFMKFGSKENMEDLLYNGTIYMNTVQYFRDIEDHNLRGDDYEGASKIINSLPGTFKILGIDREFEYKKVHLKKSYETILGNIYCLYCVSSHGFPNPFDFKIDQRIAEFGSYCLMVKDNRYFLDAIEKELKKNNCEFEHSFIEYYDKNIVNKKLSLFEKSNEYEYQKEFRIYVFNTEISPISIKIGSLEGKAELFKTEDILKMEARRKEG